MALRKSTLSVSTLLAAVAVMDRGMSERGRGPSAIRETLRQFEQGMSMYIFSSVAPTENSAPHRKGKEEGSEAWEAQNSYWNSVKGNPQNQETKEYPNFGRNSAGLPVTFTAKGFRIAPSVDTLLEWFDAGVNFWDDANDRLIETREEIVARAENENLDLRGCLIVRTDTNVPSLAQVGTNQGETVSPVTSEGIPSVA